MFTALEALNPRFIEQPLAELWQLISPLALVDESAWLAQLLPLARPSTLERRLTQANARQLIERVRADKQAVQLIDALLQEYSLDTKEGILLMCLAEALMRIPDTVTADALIRDKLSVADWQPHLRHSTSPFVNASTWGLLLTGKVVNLERRDTESANHTLTRLVNKVTEPVIRQAMSQAMKIMAYQFVLGRDMQEAQVNSQTLRAQGYRYSFDMLGESALTTHDAQQYGAAYRHAIRAAATIDANGNQDAISNSTASISIKLSALHPRYQASNQQRVLSELHDTLLQLAVQAKAWGVGICIDAEEADRLEISLQLFAQIYQHPQLRGWGDFGIVVQAYSKRALPVLTWLAGLAKQQGDMIPVRLVKGAYWDSEIKLAQQQGYAGYPVYTRKAGTDVAYLACARFLLTPQVQGYIYPQFASHNAHTVAAVATMATHREFEFQRLHGMGDVLYRHALAMFGVNVRIYAPVGSHENLLPYLVRRLLENGANSSFVHRLVDSQCAISDLIAHPTDTLARCPTLHNPRLPLPINIFADRQNSTKVNINISSARQALLQSIMMHMQQIWQAVPMIYVRPGSSPPSADKHVDIVTAPYDRRIQVGTVQCANANQVTAAIDSAEYYFPTWSRKSVSERALCLDNMANLLTLHSEELVALCHLEAGKTLDDGLDEVREAVDFCRYYALQARTNFADCHTRHCFDGVTRQVKRQGLGVFVCISPWNFPLAIFVGQIAAALVTGNTVLAKPAPQTNLIAALALQLFRAAGVPEPALQLLPGDGAIIGQLLTQDPRVAGVVFTGSTTTAQQINRTLSQRDLTQGNTGLATLIAETGGQNTMLVDSTALPEQVVQDVLRSAFTSAGQRCSALRVLFVQVDIADRILVLLQGAMLELRVGKPYLLATDVGPVIDSDAKARLQAHIDKLSQSGQLIAQTPLSSECEHGDFIAPVAFEIHSIKELQGEIFGPVLHIIRYQSDELEGIIADINGTGFGLTMAIHSRNDNHYRDLVQRVGVGNYYINRDQVGAVVGVQPFGGQGLSGTGPKAGGPHYLYRFSRPQYCGDVCIKGSVDNGA